MLPENLPGCGIGDLKVAGQGQWTEVVVIDDDGLMVNPQFMNDEGLLALLDNCRVGYRNGIAGG